MLFRAVRLLFCAVPCGVVLRGFFWGPASRATGQRRGRILVCAVVRVGRAPLRTSPGGAPPVSCCVCVCVSGFPLLVLKGTYKQKEGPGWGLEGPGWA